MQPGASGDNWPIDVGHRMPGAPLSPESPLESPASGDSHGQVLPGHGAVLAGVAVGLLVTVGMVVGGVLLWPCQFAPFFVYPAAFAGVLSGMAIADRVARRHAVASQFYNGQNLTGHRAFSVLRAAAYGALAASAGAALLGVSAGLHSADMPGLALGATLGGGGAAALSQYRLPEVEQAPAVA
ncbi:MAG: hypothetical protein EOO38_15210 [Cytophagaceae bacterium]|nr:MAG: hypothetical protein EOO38_15210 [Cytophagaceae bacterium]